MIAITISAEGATVADALANLAAIARSAQDLQRQGRRGGTVILDGAARPVYRGGNRIGSIAAEADSDAEKLAHYTRADR